MHISRVEIQNFRNFKKLDVRIGHTAVIVGENKVGKSNFLYALRLVLDPSLPDSSRKLRVEDFWDGISEPPSGSLIRVSIELSDFEGSTNAKAVLADSIVSHDPMVARLTYEFRPKPVNAPESAPLTIDDYEFVIYGGANQTRAC